MKTSKIITTVLAMNLVVFMSVSSIANSFTGITGDDNNKSVKNQTESDKSSIVDITSKNASKNEFSNLRFDVHNFNIERELEELPLNPMIYLRFDASDYLNGNSSEITELPSMNSFDHLRFDVNNYNNALEIYAMPANEFDYLRFDVNKYSNESANTIDVLPVN